MNTLLTPEGIAGKDEFVTTPKPNEYMVTLRLGPTQAAAFDGSERVMIHMGVEQSGNAGVAEVYRVNDDNTAGEPFFGGGQPNEAQIDVMRGTEERVFNAVKYFVDAVGWDDMDEYYAANGSVNPLEAALRQLLG